MLPARLALKGERLSRMVDDRAAVYPVTIGSTHLFKDQADCLADETCQTAMTEFENLRFCLGGHGGGWSALGTIYAAGAQRWYLCMYSCAAGRADSVSQAGDCSATASAYDGFGVCLVNWGQWWRER